MTANIDSSELIKVKQLLTGIGVISKLAMLEQSSKAGDKTRKAVRRAFRASKTAWTQDYVNGRRVIRKSPNGSLSQALGIRISHGSGNIDNPSNMANFITSFTHKTTGTTVVGGVHPSHRPVEIKNGKVMGYLPKQSGISKQTIAILEKLNYGARKGRYGSSDYLKWRTKDGGQSSDSIDNFKDKWKARHFFEDGWNTAKGQVISDMTTKLEELIGQRANNTDLTKVKEYAI